MHRFPSVATIPNDETMRSHQSSVGDQLRSLQRWTAVSSLGLLAVTWRLWGPQLVYPQIPVFEFLCDAPRWLDWIALVGVLLGLAVLCLRSEAIWNASASGLVLVCLLILFSLDQHRFQPWAYELALFCWVWLMCREELRLRLLRYLLISIYFYSALGKIDFEFLHTVGQQMLGAITTWVGIDSTELPMATRLLLVATFPFLELVIALGLMGSRTRKIAGWSAIGLHCGLMAILGPFGLNHRAGVLLWNAQIAVQVYWLFLAKQVAVPEKTLVVSRLRVSNLLGASVIGAALILPITERSGLWDHWPSWALYAPHSSRVQVEVAPPAIERLPESLRRFVSLPATESDEVALWVPVPIDAWSLGTLGTPIYPQARFQLGIAEAVARELDADFQVRVTVLGTAARSSGARRKETITTLYQLSSASRRYWMNTHPRRDP